MIHGRSRMRMLRWVFLPALFGACSATPVDRGIGAPTDGGRDVAEAGIASAVITRVGAGHGIPVASDKLESIQGEFLSIDFVDKLIQQSRNSGGWSPPMPNSLPDYRLSVRYPDGTSATVEAWGEFYFHVTYGDRRGFACVFAEMKKLVDRSEASKFLVSLYRETRDAGDGKEH